MLLRGDERELLEAHGVVALLADPLERLDQRLAGPRRQPDLVGVDVQEPVGLELRGERCLAREQPTPGVRAVPRQALDADQPPAEVLARDLHRSVGGVVVEEVRLDAVAVEVLDAAADEALLVEGGDDGDRAHGPRLTREGPVRGPLGRSVCLRRLAGAAPPGRVLHHGHAFVSAYGPWISTPSSARKIQLLTLLM